MSSIGLNPKKLEGGEAARRYSKCSTDVVSDSVSVRLVQGSFFAWIWGWESGVCSERVYLPVRQPKRTSGRVLCNWTSDQNQV